VPPYWSPPHQDPAHRSTRLAPVTTDPRAELERRIEDPSLRVGLLPAQIF
jgi:hypothetical protein